MPRFKFTKVSLILFLVAIVLVGCSEQGAIDKRADFLDRKVAIVDLQRIISKHPLTTKLDNLEEKIINYKLTIKDELTGLAKTEENTGKYLNKISSQMDGRLGTLEEDYQKKIVVRRKEAEQFLHDYREKLKEDSSKQLKDYQEKLESKLQDKIRIIQNEYDKKLSEYKSSLNEEYKAPILNLKLKLQIIQLNQEDKKKYQARLEKLVDEKDKKLRLRKNKYQNSVQSLIEQEEKEFKIKIEEYQKQLQKNMEKKLIEKESEVKKSLKADVDALKNNFEIELQGEESELKEGVKDNLTSVRNELLIKARTKISNLEKELKKLEETKKELKDKRRNEIDRLIKKIVSENKVELVLTEYQENVNAIDMTDEVLEKMNL